MRQAASLDIIADIRPRRAPEDSRSTSSSSSPAPPDNEESDFFLAGNESESSLGVPNIQDMQVNDDECLPPVHRVPNEILIAVFAKLSSSSDLLNVMLTCKRWARNAVDILWHRPSCSTWQKHESICQTLSLENPYFSYRNFVRRLNLAALANSVNDGSVMPLAECTRVERLTLTGCSKLTDSGLIALITNNSHLYSLDVSLPAPTPTTEAVLPDHITEASIDALSDNCPRLQGLNISGCQRISNESLIRLAQRCKYIKRLKLNDCVQIQDSAVLAFAENCPNILEIDLNQCRLIGNEPVTALFTRGQALRELRLANCELIDDSAFLSLPSHRKYEHLRILDISSSLGITDRAIEKIIDVAPRLRNLVLQKCRNLTDAAVYAISRLGKNLHFLHLGHCGHITDDGVKRLVSMCNRIRYIDLGCCTNLTDDSVTRLAQLPKLKRIGLVKCAHITDASVIALANANRRPRMRRDGQGAIIGTEYGGSQSCLERVHLSYCVNLTQASIIRLLNSCPRLTHLSLTGVQAFLRDDLEQFSRPAPPEFTDHQRSVFCVFSGQGVVALRKHFNKLITDESRRRGQEGLTIFPTIASGQPMMAVMEGTPEDGDADGMAEDELEDGSEMVIDTQPLLNSHGIGLGVDPTAVGAIPAPPPIPAIGQAGDPANPYYPFSYVYQAPYAGVNNGDHGTAGAVGASAPQFHSAPAIQGESSGNAGVSQGFAGTVGSDSATADAGTNGHSHLTPAMSTSAEQLQPGPDYGHQAPPPGGSGGT